MTAIWIGPRVATIGPGERGEVFPNPVAGDWRPLVFRVHPLGREALDIPCQPEEIRVEEERP